jgi:hypothetical protein
VRLVAAAMLASLLAASAKAEGPASSYTAPVRSRFELLSLSSIWKEAPHCAFTDLAYFRGLWLCAFREGAEHALCEGKVRVIASDDGKEWRSVALVSLKGTDLRDPKLCESPGGELDLVFGASPIEDGRYVGRTTMACRTGNGLTWGAPRRIVAEGDWLWRVEAKEGRSYGISYRLPAKRRWTVHLMESPDGLEYRELGELKVPGLPSEATIRFRGDEAIALVRREKGEGRAWIGHSGPPYADWRWSETTERLGGPNFLVLPDGSLLAAARIWRGEEPRVALLEMGDASLAPVLELPSGGDCGYPGMVLRRGELWLSYYSSHEGSARIYLARIALGL